MKSLLNSGNSLARLLTQCSERSSIAPGSSIRNSATPPYVFCNAAEANATEAEAGSSDKSSDLKGWLFAPYASAAGDLYGLGMNPASSTFSNPSCLICKNDG